MFAIKKLLYVSNAIPSSAPCWSSERVARASGGQQGWPGVRLRPARVGETWRSSWPALDVCEPIKRGGRRIVVRTGERRRRLRIANRSDARRGPSSVTQCSSVELASFADRVEMRRTWTADLSVIAAFQLVLFLVMFILGWGVAENCSAERVVACEERVSWRGANDPRVPVLRVVQYRMRRAVRQ